MILMAAIIDLHCNSIALSTLLLSSSQDLDNVFMNPLENRSGPDGI
jgi:hypothetical protein